MTCEHLTLVDERPSDAETVGLFEKAVLLHTRRLTSIARAVVGRRAAPEDVVQQAIVKLFEHRSRYDWREPGPLLRRAVLNEAIRVLRQPRVTQLEGDFPTPTRSTPERGLIEREVSLKVRAAVDDLPTHFRAALVLCEYEDMPYTQIAEVLGVSMAQVKTWLHRGRKRLARVLDDCREVKEPTRRTPGGLARVA